MPQNKNTRADFVYWATQYIKRKCISVKIKETELEGGGVQLDWGFRGKDRTAIWSAENIRAVLGTGADQTRQAIQEAVRAQLPELFPPEEDA